MIKITDTSSMLFDQITTISKAAAYDVISKQNNELKEENKMLKDKVEQMSNLLLETLKQIKNLK